MSLLEKRCITWQSCKLQHQLFMPHQVDSSIRMQKHISLFLSLESTHNLSVISLVTFWSRTRVSANRSVFAWSGQPLEGTEGPECSAQSPPKSFSIVYPTSDTILDCVGTGWQHAWMPKPFTSAKSSFPDLWAPRPCRRIAFHKALLTNSSASTLYDIIVNVFPSPSGCPGFYSSKQTHNSCTHIGQWPSPSFSIVSRGTFAKSSVRLLSYTFGLRPWLRSLPQRKIFGNPPKERRPTRQVHSPIDFSIKPESDRLGPDWRHDCQPLLGAYWNPLTKWQAPTVLSLHGKILRPEWTSWLQNPPPLCQHLPHPFHFHSMTMLISLVEMTDSVKFKQLHYDISDYIT